MNRRVGQRPRWHVVLLAVGPLRHDTRCVPVRSAAWLSTAVVGAKSNIGKTATRESAIRDTLWLVYKTIANSAEEEEAAGGRRRKVGPVRLG